MKKSSFVRPPLHPPIPAPPPPPSVPRPQGYTAAYCHWTDGAAVRCAPSQRYLTAASGRGRQRTCASLVLLRVNSVRVKRGHEGAFQGLTSRAQRRSRGRLQGPATPLPRWLRLRTPRESSQGTAGSRSRATPLAHFDLPWHSQVRSKGHQEGGRKRSSQRRRHEGRASQDPPGK